MPSQMTKTAHPERKIIGRFGQADQHCNVAAPPAVAAPGDRQSRDFCLRSVGLIGSFWQEQRSMVAMKLCLSPRGRLFIEFSESTGE